jgi:hypothetical protein
MQRLVAHGAADFRLAPRRACHPAAPPVSARRPPLTHRCPSISPRIPSRVPLPSPPQRVYGAFFVAVTWLATALANEYGMPPPVALAITILSLLFNSLGLGLAGWGFDHGMPSIKAWALTVIIGVSSGFGLYYWCVGGGRGHCLGLGLKQQEPCTSYSIIIQRTPARYS